MKIFKWIWIKLGQSRHNYTLIEYPNKYQCTKCKRELHIPEFSEWQYRVEEFKGCKK